MLRRCALLVAVIALALGTVGGCSRASSSGLENYTDPGDGCQQAISAISYADDVLEPLGQEPYQDFTDEVRSKVASVAGQLALEARDWPSRRIHRQADTVQALAEAAAVKQASDARVRALLEYRGEAAKLVLLCRDAIGDAP